MLGYFNGKYFEVREDPVPSPFPTYEEQVASRIRARYSADDEFALSRQRYEKPEEWQEYTEYCEQCKLIAREEVTRLVCRDLLA